MRLTITRLLFRSRTARYGLLPLVGALAWGLPVMVPVDIGADFAVAQSIEDRKAEAERLSEQAFEEYQNNKWWEALESLENALGIYQEIGERAGEAQTLNSIGLMNQLLGNYSQALENCKQSLVISQEIGDRATVANVLNNIGIVYYLLGNYPQALENTERLWA